VIIQKRRTTRERREERVRDQTSPTERHRELKSSFWLVHTHTHTHIHTLSLSSRVRAVCCRSFFLFWIVKPRPSLPLNNPAIPHMLDIYPTLYTSLYGSYTNMSRPSTPPPPTPPGRRKRRVGQKISSTRHVWNPAPALNRDYTGLVELLGRYMENKSPACDYY
jgi:hypothetical protein